MTALANHNAAAASIHSAIETTAVWAEGVPVTTAAASVQLPDAGPSSSFPHINGIHQNGDHHHTAAAAPASSSSSSIIAAAPTSSSFTAAPDPAAATAASSVPVGSSSSAPSSTAAGADAKTPSPLPPLWPRIRPCAMSSSTWPRVTGCARPARRCSCGSVAPMKWNWCAWTAGATPPPRRRRVVSGGPRSRSRSGRRHQLALDQEREGKWVKMVANWDRTMRKVEARRKVFQASVDPEAANNLRWACHFARVGPGDVCVFFHDRLMYGPRVQKISAHATENKAFDCPKTSPLVIIEKHGRHEVQLWNDEVRKKREEIAQGKFRDARPKLHRIELNEAVIMLRLYPGISGHLLRALMQMNPPPAGLVLQTYGAGNGPIGTAQHPSDFTLAIQEMLRAGVIVCYVTECLKGQVSKEYELTLAVTSQQIHSAVWTLNRPVAHLYDLNRFSCPL